MTQWNFRHIEFLIDIAEAAKDIYKLSATRLRRFNELQAAGLVTLWDDKPYAKLTPKGKKMLTLLEQEFEHYINVEPEELEED